MLDVSKLPSGHAEIALLIERRGDTGRRVCELVKEVIISKPSVCRILSDLVEWGYCQRINGDVPRYYPPSVSLAQPSVSLAQPPVSLAQPPVSPFCGESVVNMLTSVNTTNETNKEDSEISFGTQASVSPGVAGQHAIEAELIPPASAVPADSFRSAGGAKIHSAGGAANTPEMPEKIDADAFGRQTGQILPDCQTAAQPPTPATIHLTVTDEASQRSLFRILQTEAVNCPGTVFTPGMTDPTESLYQMFTNMQGRHVADPDAKSVIKCLSDYVKPHDAPMIPAEEAFEKYIRIIWELIIEAEVQGGKDAIKTYDFIVQRAAYPYVMENWDEIPHLHWQTPDRLIAAALDRDRRKYFYNHLVGMLWEVYSQLGYGWDVTALYNGRTWKVEIDRYGFQGARRDLFRSFFHNQASQTKMGKSLAKKTGTGKKASQFAAAVKPLLRQNRDEAERQVRIDAACRSGDPGEAVLVCIAEKLGEKHFDLWFGQDTQCRIDESEKKVLFSVSGGARRVVLLKQHCSLEINAAVAELYPGFEPVFAFLPPPSVDRDQDVAQAMALAASCNAEARERQKKLPQRPLTIGELGKRIEQSNFN